MNRSAIIVCSVLIVLDLSARSSFAKSHYNAQRPAQDVRIPPRDANALYAPARSPAASFQGLNYSAPAGR